MGAVVRKEVFASCGSLGARRAGPWRMVIVNDMVGRSRGRGFGDVTKETVEVGYICKVGGS